MRTSWLVLAILWVVGAQETGGDLCRYNCPDWSAAQAAIRKIRTTGVTTLKELSIFTNTSYTPPTAVEKAKNMLFRSTYTEIKECSHRPDRPGPGCIFCQMMRTALTYPASRQLEASQKLYDIYHQAANPGLRGQMTGWNNDIALALREWFPPSSHPRVLDGGVGTCGMVRKLIELGYNGYGHEPSERRINENCHELSVSHGILKETPYPEGFLDVVSSVECIEHIPVEDIRPTFEEISRILRPGGIFVFTLGPCFTVCNGFCSWEAIHPSGLCKKYPRKWWDQTLQSTGFRRLDGDMYHAFLKSLGVKEGVCEGKGGTQKCGTEAAGAFNPDGHRYFVYRRTT